MLPMMYSYDDDDAIKFVPKLNSLKMNRETYSRKKRCHSLEAGDKESIGEVHCRRGV